MAARDFEPELIEQIVQEVLRRLRARGVQVGTDAAPPCETAELVLAERLVTLATLDGRLTGVQRLVVGTRAVVTPAVKDALRDQRIELLRR